MRGKTEWTPPHFLCGPMGLAVMSVVVVVAIGLALLWWDATPLVGLAVVVMTASFVAWFVMASAFFGRWGASVAAAVPYPIWMPWVLLVAGLGAVVLGVLAILDGAETRAGVIAIVLGLVFTRMWFFGAWVLLALWRSPFVMLVIGAVAVGLVAAIIALVDADRTYAPWVVLLALLWPVLMIVVPMLTHRRQLVGLAPIGGPFPFAMWLAPIVAVVLGVVMTFAVGLISSTPTGESGPSAQGSEGEPRAGEPGEAQPIDAADSADPPPADPPPVLSTGDDDEPAQNVTTQPTYRMAISDGRSFPIYRFSDGNQEALGIVIPKPDPCWVLQYDAGVAEQLGECSERWVNDVVPERAFVLFESEASFVVQLTFDEQLVVTDFAAIQGGTTAQGFEGELGNQFFETVVTAGGSFELEGQTFIA
ncbi:MAG: hypothetical protein AAF548_16995 [Actinomycetota bacterium]